MRGRKPKPSIIKAAEGNRRKVGRDRIKDDPPGLGKPRPPADFEGEELKCWLAVAGSLPKGLLSAADDAILERHAVEWATYREVRRTIRATGYLVNSPQGPIRNPLLVVRNNAGRAMHLAGSEIGLSPVARARLVGADADDQDPMALLLGLDEDEYTQPAPSRTRN